MAKGEPRRWSKTSQDRACVLLAAVLSVASFFRLLRLLSVGGADLHAATVLAPLGGFLAGALVILSLVPSPWVQPTYGVEPLLDFETELDLTLKKIPLNHFQVVGTHNSVHVAGLFSMFIPYWQYTHLTLIDQLNLGIRHIELDLWYNKNIQAWEVWHECVDRLTVTPLMMADVLSQIYTWSKSRQGHFPLTINMDIKGAYWSYTSYLTPWLLGRGFKDGTPADVQIFQMLEREVLATWSIPDLLTPASMKFACGEKTMRDAIMNHGWPNVDDLKGKTIFQLNLNGKKAKPLSNAIKSSTVMFMRGHNYDDPEPEAAWFESNDPEQISSLTQKGYVVRTLDVHAKAGSNPPKSQYVATNHPASYPLGVLLPLIDAKLNARSRSASYSSVGDRNLCTMLEEKNG